MVKILVYNSKCRYIGRIKYLDMLRKDTRIRAKGAFFSPAFRKRQWDGYVYYITEKGGLFETGLLPLMYEKLRSYGQRVELIDKRESFRNQYNVNELGGMGFRGYQLEGLKSALGNKFQGIRYQRGILSEATNAGKSLIAGGIYASLSSKRMGLFLVNSKTLYEQSVRDFEKLLPGEVGQVNAKKTNWKRINICMVQTLGNRISKDHKFLNSLAKVDVIIVDEADEVINRKDCQRILSACYNATIRIALTGTPQLSDDKNRNMKQIAYFGPILHSTTNKELVDQGVSTPPDIRMYMGNKHVIEKGDYQREYSRGIIKNKRRHRKIWRLVSRYAERKDAIPCLIIFKNHEQAISLMEQCPDELRDKYRIKTVHHKTKNRTQIVEDFRRGKIDILVGSMILARGKNMPRIKLLTNAAGGTSHARILQIFGRSLRKHKSKEKVYIIDFWDVGEYLRLHSVRRLRYYKAQKFGVREIYKKHLKTK